MKKLILILFLFYAKAAAAQGFNYGLSSGDLLYRFNEGGATYNHSSLSLGVCVQYVLKDSLFGIEGNFFFYTAPPIYGSSTDAFAPYFFYNPWHSHHVSAEFKLGMLVSHNAGTTTQPVNDFGPSAGLFVCFILRHVPEMGLDFTVVPGQQSYTLYESGPLVAPDVPAYSSKVITYNLSLKVLVP
jgi:hypothetical protein